MKLKLFVVLVSFFVVTQAHATPTLDDVTLNNGPDAYKADAWVIVNAADLEFAYQGPQNDTYPKSLATTDVLIHLQAVLGDAKLPASDDYVLISRAAIDSSGYNSNGYTSGQLLDYNGVLTDISFDGAILKPRPLSTTGTYTVDWYNSGDPLLADFWLFLQPQSADLDSGELVAYHFSNVLLSTTDPNGDTLSGAWTTLSIGNDTLYGMYLYVGQPFMDPNPPAVPEPATMLLFGAGLAGLAGISRRRLKK